jgi:antiphage defense system Thoeris ThsB-like protein
MIRARDEAQAISLTSDTEYGLSAVHEGHEVAPSSQCQAVHHRKTVVDTMVAIERDNPRFKGVLPKEYARPASTSSASANSSTSLPRSNSPPPARATGPRSIVVLIGTETAARPWVKYEIEQSIAFNRPLQREA